MTTKVYVLEGADATGKSTLALTMQTRSDLDDPYLEYVYIHNTADDAKLPGSLYRHYRAQLLDALDRDNVVTIIDRSWLSEFVYGTVYRGKARITARQVNKLNRFAAKHGITLIGLHAHDSVRRLRMHERGEEWDPKQYEVAQMYTEVFQASPAWTYVDSSSAFRP